MSLKFFKVTTLPATLEADALYFVQNGNYAESYLTNSAGAARSIGNSAMIQAIAGPLITAALANVNQVKVFATIAERNAAVDPGYNYMALVTNATTDNTVAAGAAMYFWNTATDTWTKVSEYESMDIQLTWAALQGKPTSAPAQIDDAVAKRHEHSNKSYLDKIGESSGAMTYNGNPVSSNWSETNW